MMQFLRFDIIGFVNALSKHAVQDDATVKVAREQGRVFLNRLRARAGDATGVRMQSFVIPVKLSATSLDSIGP